ncbi:MAG: DUF5615 family PIN-like protein [Planctomycetia bacterium]|nr:DUF5615 family PIN-like protein [Planctomycetia bacterium]
MARFYSNENFPFPVVEELRKLGHLVLTIQETGSAGGAVPDEQMLETASRDGRTVLTLNRKHFVRLHAARPDHAGIVVCTLDCDFSRQAARIHAEIQRRATLRGQLIRVNRPAN